MVDYVTVHSKDDIRGNFKDGAELKAYPHRHSNASEPHWLGGVVLVLL